MEYFILLNHAPAVSFPDNTRNAELHFPYSLENVAPTRLFEAMSFL